jgi:hypothetical protein
VLDGAALVGIELGGEVRGHGLGRIRIAPA